MHWLQKSDTGTNVHLFLPSIYGQRDQEGEGGKKNHWNLPLITRSAIKYMPGSQKKSNLYSSGTQSYVPQKSV